MGDDILHVAFLVALIFGIIILAIIDSRKRLPKPVKDKRINKLKIDLSACQNVDMAKLISFYEKTVKRKNRLLRSAKRRVTFLNLLIGVSLLVIPFAGENLLQVPILLFYVLFVYAVFGYILLMKFKTDEEISRFFNKTDFKELSKDSFPDTWLLAETLKQKMGLDDFELKLFFIPANSYSPSVAEKNNTIEIYFPRNFLALMHQKPDVLEPILVHELAHIKHRDQESSLFLEIYLRKVKIPFAIIIILFVFSYLLYLAGETGSPSFILIKLIGVIIAFTFIAGKQSEYLADMAVLVYSDPAKFAEYLSENTGKDSIFNKHPTVKQRLRNYNALREKFGTPLQSEAVTTS